MPSAECVSPEGVPAFRLPFIPSPGARARLPVCCWTVCRAQGCHTVNYLAEVINDRLLWLDNFKENKRALPRPP